MPYGFNFTDRFWVNHIRILSDPGPNGLPPPLPATLAPLWAGPTNQDNDELIRRAALVLSARQEELGHKSANTVIFVTLGSITNLGIAVNAIGPNRVDTNINIRPNLGPTVVTMTPGFINWEVVSNAAGIIGNTNGSTDCYHYEDRLVDINSQIQ